MAKVSPLINNFSSGEFGPLASARVDLDRYGSSLDTCLNNVPVIQGGVTRRPGTKYVGTTKTSGAARLEKFIFSRDQAYVLEFGDLYVRFYTDNAQILDTGVPVEVVTPYTTAQLFEITFTQSNDIIYIFHEDHAPRKLIRISDTNWIVVSIVFEDGPYDSINPSANIARLTANNDITPLSATGSSVSVVSGVARFVSNAVSYGGEIKITESVAQERVTGDKVQIGSVFGTVEANGDWTIEVIDTTNFILKGSVFVNAYTGSGSIRPWLWNASDVGQPIRLLTGSTWGWGIIIQYLNSASIYVNVQKTFTDINPKTTWRLGAYGSKGYPSSGCFHEDRLFMFGPGQYVAGSKVGDYENFSPSAMDGAVVSSNAVSFELNSNSSNNAKWIVSDEKGLIAGTDANEWLVRGSTSNDPISPTSINAKEVTSYGSKNVFPVKAGKAVLFTETSGRKLREFNYFYDVDGFRCTDLTQLAHHVLQSGVVQMALQRQPYSLVWACRTDGLLACLTYERDVEGLKVGWHRHQIGGVSDAGGTNAKVESVTVIPSSNGEYDELWMVVNRRINGATVRYVEYMTKFFEEEDEQVDAFFVDSGLTYDSPKTITAITKASPGVVTSAGHGFSNDDQVVIRDVLGMTEVNDNVYTCKNVAANTFELYDSTGTAINSTDFTTYVSGGEARKLVTTISGLSHLEGQTVKMLGDGAVLEDAVVTAGAVTLSYKSATVQIGLGYNSDLKLPRLEAGAQDGTSLGKNRRTHRVGVLMHRSLGLKYGQNFTDMTSIEFQDGNDELDHSPDLFTGIESMEFAADYDKENQICLRQDQPLPSTILAIMPQLVTQDRG